MFIYYLYFITLTPISDHLSEYSSTLSSAMSGQTASSVSVHSGSSLQLSISSTRVLFDVLETSLKDECDSAIVAGSLSLLLSSFLAENGCVWLVDTCGFVMHI